MPVTVEKESCLGCGACVAGCPVGALTLNADGVAECDKDLCVDCCACVDTCPAGAIKQD